MSVAGIVGTLLIFGAIILVHEFGHFIVAKLSGMTVYEFSLGFGPALLSHIRSGTQYAIRIIPLGGYVRIAGMEPNEDEGTTDKTDGAAQPEPEGSFNNKPFIARFATIVAGALMNMVFAFLIIVVLGMAVGYPVPGKKVFVSGVMPHSPAERAGIQIGDQIVQIGKVANPRVERVTSLIKTTPPPIPMVLLRDGKRIPMSLATATITTPKDSGKSFIIHMGTYQGIGIVLETFSGEWKRASFFDSVKTGCIVVYGSIVEGIRQIASLAAGHIPFNQLNGPIGIGHAIYKQTKNAASSRYGLYSALSLAALISVLIGLFNLLPIPALDGSRLMFIVIGQISGKPINREKEALVHMIGLVILLGLILLVSIKNDIFQF